MTPRAVLRISAKRLGPNATRAANPSPAATIPPRESVAQSASTTAGSAATASPRPRRLDPGRCATEIRHDGEPTAALIHDESLADGRTTSGQSAPTPWSRSRTSA